MESFSIDYQEMNIIFNRIIPIIFELIQSPEMHLSFKSQKIIDEFCESANKIIDQSLEELIPEYKIVAIEIKKIFDLELIKKQINYTREKIKDEFLD